MKTIAVVGVPASGKTSIFRQLLKEGAPFQYRLLRGVFDKARNLYWIGVFDGSTFEGTDRLSMAVMPDAVAFLKHLAAERPNSTVIFEGDRLGSSKFLDEAAQVGDVVLFLVQAKEEILRQRHEARHDGQTEQWLRGRETKVRKLAEKFEPKAVLNNLMESDLRSNAQIVADEAGAVLAPEPKPADEASAPFPAFDKASPPASAPETRDVPKRKKRSKERKT